MGLIPEEAEAKGSKDGDAGFRDKVVDAVFPRRRIPSPLSLEAARVRF